MDEHEISLPQFHSLLPVLDSAPTFSQTWSPSKAAVLDTASLAVTRVHRGWERAPQSPQAEHSRVKKVWKRYELRSHPNEKNQEEDRHSNETQKSPMRIVKKLRIKSPHKPGLLTAEKFEGEKEATYHAPTRWDRRRSALRRMLLQNLLYLNHALIIF